MFTPVQVEYVHVHVYTTDGKNYGIIFCQLVMNHDDNTRDFTKICQYMILLLVFPLAVILIY